MIPRTVKIQGDSKRNSKRIRKMAKEKVKEQLEMCKWKVRMGHADRGRNGLREKHQT